MRPFGLSGEVISKMGAFTATTYDLDVMVVSFTGDTGLADYSASLCRELCKLVTIELVTAQSFEEVKYEAKYPVFKLFRRTRNYPLDFCHFVLHVIRHRPRVLLLQSWLKWPILELPWIVLFRALGIRMALTVHDLLPHYPKPWSKIVLRLFYRQFDRLIVHSQHQSEDLRNMGVATPCLVVPHGVYDIFNTQNLDRTAGRVFFPGLHESNFVVLFFGRLEERKGLLDFLRTAELLEVSEPSIRFMVAGKSEESTAVREALSAARMRSNVLMHDHLIPHIEVQRFFAACDMVAMPYHEGTSSGVMKLAMAFRRPVVCTDVGDFAESLEVWPGLMVDQMRLPESLVEKVRQARNESKHLAAGTTLLSKETQWCSIASRYVSYLM
jgi:glycosyltransferase involved in cell wall biosynthesis